MGLASAIGNCIWCLSILRTNLWSICWEKGSLLICRAHDCLGRTLDWIYEHDVTTLFAGLALQARQRFGIKAHGLHIDTTSFSVNGEYASKEVGDPVPIAITYGYSRDHRADIKQWMLELATTQDGNV